MATMARYTRHRTKATEIYKQELINIASKTESKPQQLCSAAAVFIKRLNTSTINQSFSLAYAQ